MPSDTFLRLSDVKKKKLIDASIKEFSLYNYNEVSINRIIKDASISRGSFYMYFDDKRDLYFYLLEQHREILCKGMQEDLIKNNGDIFKMFQDNIKKSYHILNDSKLAFFLKTLENITVVEEENKTFGFRDKTLLNELVPYINLSLLNDNAKKHIEIIFAINMHLLIITLLKLLKSEVLDNDIVEDYYEQVNIFKFGCVKE